MQGKKMQITKNFRIEEFIPPEVFNTYAHKSIWFLDPVMFELAEFVRNFYDKPMRINNWLWGGAFRYRGFRTHKSGVGAEFSQHKFGRAFDFDIEGESPEQIQHDILNNELLFMEHGLRALELDTDTWTHMDIRNTQMDKIMLVPNPKKRGA